MAQKSLRVNIKDPITEIKLIIPATYLLLTKPKYVMSCAIWYYLYNSKSVKNIHGRVLLSVKLQAKSLY